MYINASFSLKPPLLKAVLQKDDFHLHYVVHASMSPCWLKYTQNLPKMLSAKIYLLCCFSVPIMLALCSYVSNIFTKVLINDCFIGVFHYKLTIEYQSKKLYTMYLSVLLQFEFTSDCSIREHRSYFQKLKVP